MGLRHTHYYIYLLFCIACVCAQLLQSCPTLCNPMDNRPTGSSVQGDSPGTNTGVGGHALLQRSFPPRDQTHIPCDSCTAGGFSPTEPPGKPRFVLRYSQLTNNVVTVSGEQQRDSAIHIRISILPQTPLPFRMPHNLEHSSGCYRNVSC